MTECFTVSGGNQSTNVTTTQLTLVQIDNYGPWTVTPAPRREVDLQTLQSRLYADLSQYIGNRDGYAFFTRFDNMIAVTNGLDESDHARLQETISNRYPVTVSLSTASDPNPVTALERATKQLQQAGSAQDGSRREILRLDDGSPVQDDGSEVHIAHFDVNDATGQYTDEINAFDTFIEIEQAYASLMRYMRTHADSLSFFVGGDNIIAVCPDLAPETYQSAIDHVEQETNVALKVGVGIGRRAHPAGMAAKHALEACRSNGSDVEFARPTA